MCRKLCRDAMKQYEALIAFHFSLRNEVPIVSFFEALKSNFYPIVLETKVIVLTISFRKKSVSNFLLKFFSSLSSLRNIYL